MQAYFFAAWPFDAVTILARAMNSSGSTEPGALRRAILAIRGHGGAEGEFNFDNKGDGRHGEDNAELRDEGGRVVFVRRFQFQ